MEETKSVKKTTIIIIVHIISMMKPPPIIDEKNPIATGKNSIATTFIARHAIMISSTFVSFCNNIKYLSQ